jgi:glycine betaine catabolism B
MWEFETKLSDVISLTPRVKSFRFPRVDSINYEAGQFFSVVIRVKGEYAEHHFSFSSSPSDEGYIEFTKRITASDFSQALDNLKPGDPAFLKGPEGEFVLTEKPEKLAFLSGGIGITPLRSMLRFMTARNLPFDVTLLYGNANYEDIIFREELNGLAAISKRITVIHTLSNPPPDWPGKTGFIEAAMIREVISDYQERLFYISGPVKMVQSLINQIISLGVGENRIKHDSFTGYD